MITYDDELRARITGNLARHDRIEVPLEGRRHAAVAILLLDSEIGSDGVDPHPASADGMASIPTGEKGLDAEIDGHMNGVAGGASFVLCRRAARLSTHSAQWALPGGRIDEGESIIEAALRETHEEVGVDLGQDAVLGVLDDYATRSGYVMTPVVVWGGDVDLVPSPDEVLAAYRIGLHELSRDDSPRFITIPESDKPVVQVPISGDLIHAPTGAVLVQFRWVGLEGRVGDACRVAEFEQPVFAWG